MPRDPGLPSLQALGRDLLATTPWQRRWSLIRPFALLGLYALVYRLGLWWLSPLAVFLVFVAVVTVTHDVVHGSLGLRPRATEVALFVLGGVLLASGHSYRISHLQHHRVFPAGDDPEGDPARMTLWGAVRHGPVFLPRLWRWAYRRCSAAERRWLVAEAGFALLVVAAGVWLWPVTHAVLLYVALVVSGAWVFPLLTVHLIGVRQQRLVISAFARSKRTTQLFSKRTGQRDAAMLSTVAHGLGSRCAGAFRRSVPFRTDLAGIAVIEQRRLERRRSVRRAPPRSRVTGRAPSRAPGRAPAGAARSV